MKAAARSPERIHLDLPADLRFLHIIGVCVQELLGQDAERRVLRHEVEIALHEVCVNIVVHAYDGAPNGRLEVVLSRDEVQLQAQITDRGRAFDPALVKPPDLDRGQVHGYGMFMAHALLDEVSYTRRDDVNHWRLAKRWT